MKPFSAQEYYNLRARAEKGEILNLEDEYDLIQEMLHHEDFRVRFRSRYTVDHEGNRQKRILEDIFFTSSAQILLAKRFVSEFAYVIDATFGTNRRRLPLIIVNGITSTGHTFEFGYMFIVSESAKAFTFLKDVFTELIFYDCPLPKIVLGDFAAGLIAVYGLSIDELTPGAPALEDPSHEATEAEIQIANGLEDGLRRAYETSEEEGKPDTKLQLCEWHAVTAIKRQLIACGGYPKETRKEIWGAIWNYVMQDQPDKVLESREALFRLLKPREITYLKNFYVPKEALFQRAQTRLYPNLGMNSTQRGERKHHDVKSRGLNPQLPLHSAVKVLIGQAQAVGEKYQDLLDAEFGKTSHLVDRRGGFKDVYRTLSSYCLELVRGEWLLAKQFAENVQKGEADLPVKEDTL